MKKWILTLGVIMLCVVNTSCGNVKVDAPKTTAKDLGAEEPVVQVKSVESYQKLYKTIKKITKKQKNIMRYEDSVNYATTDGMYTMMESKTEDASMSTGNSQACGTTNVVTEGIDEGDIIKNDGKYLYLYEQSYYDDKNVIRIVEADGAEMETVSCISLKDKNVQEFYVSGDQLIVLINDYDEDESYTEVVVYDIRERKNPKEMKKITQSGDLLESRMDSDYLYLVTEKYNDYLEKRSVEKCIPTVDGCKVAADCIYVPEQVDTKNFVTCSTISLKDNYHIKKKLSVMASGQDFYMSQNNMYLFHSFIENGVAKSELMRIAVKDGMLEVEAKNVVSGYLPDTFAINEYNGYLRLVMMEDENNDYSTTDLETKVVQQEQKTHLFVLDMNLEQVGEINNIAPGENVYSARFMGDTGYFVTFRSIDPLFSVDLSNPKNPKIVGELKIPGFSEYLHFYSDNLLLGIGQNVVDNHAEGLKLSMFDISDPSNVKEVNKLVLKQYDYSECLYNYKALCIEPAKNILGFSCERYENDGSYFDYVLYSYDEEQGFVENQVISGDMTDVNTMRGTFIGNTFYTIVYGKQIVATDLTTMKQVGNYKL